MPAGKEITEKGNEVCALLLCEFVGPYGRPQEHITCGTTCLGQQVLLPLCHGFLRVRGTRFDTRTTLFGLMCIGDVLQRLQLLPLCTLTL